MTTSDFLAALRSIALCALVAAPAAAGASAQAERGETDSSELTLSAPGRALATIVLASKAIPAERTAAHELADYLRKITSVPFEIVDERQAPEGGVRIHVGPTRRARHEAACMTRGSEEWVILTRGQDLLLCGGRPRGTLYAVYHLLEDHLGVRWWTPWDETVPARAELTLPALDASGEPAFAYRDVYLAAWGPVPQLFAARARLNGEFSYVKPSHGGRHAFGPPHHVHTFFMYAPPRELFREHPEYFTNVEDEADTKQGQLCLTDPGLRDHVEKRLRSYIEQSRRTAKEQGDTPPTLFSFSHNDWPGKCDCASCLPLVERQGESGALIDTINVLARRIEGDYPGVRLETLAYRDTIEPPATLDAHPGVVVRLAELFAQNFTLPLTDPGNAFYRRVLDGWLARTSHLWIWEYTTTFGLGEALPLANLPLLADNFRYYLEHGVEGVYAQHDHPILADMRYMNQWVIAKLIEDPRRDARALVAEFTSGYYGPAGGALRDYLLRLERAMAAKPTHIGYPARVDDWRYLDAGFLVEAQALFERAEQAVAGDPVALQRVRYARLSLDRATLLRWPMEFGDDTAEPPGLDPVQIVARARETAHTEIDLRLTGGEADHQHELVDRELWQAMKRIGYE